MPILKKLKELLDQAKISYEVYNHPPAYTAQEIAAAQHIPEPDRRDKVKTGKCIFHKAKVTAGFPFPTSMSNRSLRN